MISSLKHCLNYEYHLYNIDQNSLVSMSVREMAGMPLLDTWYSRMQNLKTLLHIPSMHGSKDRVSMAIGKRLNGIFGKIWLDKINAPKLGNALSHKNLIVDFKK